MIFVTTNYHRKTRSCFVHLGLLDENILIEFVKTKNSKFNFNSEHYGNKKNKMSEVRQLCPFRRGQN